MKEVPFSTRTLQICSRQFLDHPFYSDADRAIAKVVAAIPTHSELSDVLAKVSIIKTLYATPLYDTGRMASHIYGIDGIDSSLAEGNLDVVDRIRKGHKIISKRHSKEIDFYSFATKYCSFHNRNGYPIYDTLVADLVRTLLGNTGDLRDYGVFASSIDRIKQEYGADLQTYKDVDMGLWVYAKYQREQENPSKNILERAFFGDLAKYLSETE